jgi:hypothetical protein
VAEGAAHLSPVSTLFAAFLGYDPVEHLIGAHVLSQLSVAQQHALTGRSFFPGLISAPFKAGLHAALDFAIVASLLAAAASWLRGGKYVYTEEDGTGRPGLGDGSDAPTAAVRVVPGGEEDDRSAPASAPAPAPAPGSPVPAAMVDAARTGPTTTGGAES